MSQTPVLSVSPFSTVDILHQTLQNSPPNSEELFTLEGQVVHSRKLSKKLFFFDLRLTPSPSPSLSPGSIEGKDQLNCCEKLECIARYDEISLVEVDLFWRAFKLGDQVKISGTFEKLTVTSTSRHPVYLFHVKQLTVTTKWSSEVPFVPERPVREVTHKKRTSTGENVTHVETKGVCKYWINTGRCEVICCPYNHPTEPQELARLRKEWVTERIQTRRKLILSQEDPHSNELKQSHRLRAQYFVDWLIQTYTTEYLNSGEGVLDVAGGRGDVSFELHTKRGIRTTLIEPREMKFSKSQRKFLQLIVPSSGKKVEGTLCKQIRTIVDSKFIETNRDLIQNCSIIIGMHPDQATEPIVDTALKFGKPFAVVPCCVFGHENPHRRLLDGGSVIQYDDFIRYLLEKKSPQYSKCLVKNDFLNITGRNQVIFCKPYDDGEIKGGNK